MRDIFRPNQLIEIELNTNGQCEQKENFASRIEEVLSDSLVVAAPIKNGNLVFIAKGELLTLRVHINGALYSALCRVQAYSSKGVPWLKLTRPAEISKVQQRSWVRIDVMLPVEYRMAGYPVDYYQATTSDLSGGGLLMVTNHIIDNDTLLDIRVKMTDDFTVECQGRVTRCHQEGDKTRSRFKIGIKYENLEEAHVEKIVAFVFQKQRESLKKGHTVVK